MEHPGALVRTTPDVFPRVGGAQALRAAVGGRATGRGGPGRRSPGEAWVRPVATVAPSPTDDARALALALVATVLLIVLMGVAATGCGLLLGAAICWLLGLPS